MQARTTRSATDKKTGKQRVFVCLLLLPLVLFTLSAFTFIPNTTQIPNVTIGTTLPRTVQMSEMLTLSATDVSCSDVITLEKFSWSGIRIYFNACALEHFTAFVASVGAGVSAFGLVTLVCQECAPLATWIATKVSGAVAGIDFLQYAAQGCGGALLDISWDGGIQFESACSP